ncbi:MAG TPA: DUF5695 domain-containing protein [Longimicrobiales bacterium]|nr:DUF5695 domain-containing protein [Longimicrobiales bacterium]
MATALGPAAAGGQVNSRRRFVEPERRSGADIDVRRRVACTGRLATCALTRAFVLVAGAVFAIAPVAAQQPAPAARQTIERGEFRFVHDERGVSGLGKPDDPFGALAVPVAERAEAGGGGRGGAGATFGLTVAYRTGASDWVEPSIRQSFEVAPGSAAVTYRSGAVGPLEVVETYSTDGRVLDWTVELSATTDAGVTIGDLAFSVPVAGPFGEDPRQIFERGFLRHQFVSGHGSFFFFTRASGAPPYLLVTTHPGTKLEYFTGGNRGGGTVFVHSARSGPSVEGTWRQEHTSLTLGPAGTDAGAARYGLRFRWADSYDDLRRLLYEEGLFDVRVVPGMSLPSDLQARFALHTRAEIEAVEAEFPQSTRLEYLGEPEPDRHIYEVSFSRLGENRITIRHDGGHETYLEFFSTEPLETLIRKRASFLVDRQQIRDSTKWWDGVFGPYDMRESVTRTIEDPDIFIERMIYVLTADDPGLGKAPFLASKNVHWPERREIEALEYYLENFVWGGLQRTDEERPYPYGVYGTPHWYINRSPERRAEWTDRDLDREHVWRSYDYPHVVMLYYHMYQIATLYPQLSTYLDARGYLERAYRTAQAFYTYPYEIYPDYYETTKWGLYNELIVLELIDALEREGYQLQAGELRTEWEKKVKYFIYDDEYPLRSEYAFDRTAFESSYALAKYGATHDMQPDSHLWWDVQKRRWYSHPVVRREDARAFMDRQLMGNLAVRGWLETSYYQLGADPSLSYMAAMGGWGVLDYAIHFAPDPFDWLQLGYASYLSSWSLMNTGTPETNWGYWFPGEHNDGAAGWQFMSARRGSAWMGSSWPGGVQVPRGPWHYDGEIDLGFGGALRMARTLVTNDPLFGWIAYGGTWIENDTLLSVVPRDGVRKRFGVVLADSRAPSLRAQRLEVELARDGFAASTPIVVDKRLDRITFTIENRTGDTHETEVLLALPYGTTYTLEQDGLPVELETTEDWDYPWRATLRMTGERSSITLAKVAR